MIKELKLTRRKKLLGAVVICVILITGSTMLWQMGQVAEAAILDPHPGLVGWWRFDEEAGNVAKDSSGYGNDGTVYGATWVEGKYGKALSFDGTDDYADFGDRPTLNIQDSFSFGFWLRMDSFILDRTCFIVSGGSSDHPTLGKYRFAYTTGSKRLMFKVQKAGQWTNEGPQLPFDYPLGEWHHVVGVWNKTANKAYLYYDGQYQAEATTAVIELNDNGKLTLEALNAGYYWTNASLDEVRIYNRALSATEIQVIFQKGPDFSSRLLAKVPKGTTQFIATLSWQGGGSMGVTIESPSKIYTEDMVPVYHKTVYSSSSGDMLNIKRVALSVTALSSDEDWYVVLEFDDVEDYRIAVEVQR